MGRRLLLTSFSALAWLLPFAPVIAQESGDGRTTLIFVGDIMVAHDEETGKLIEQGVDPFEPFAELLSAADLAVGNLECVVADSGEAVRKPYNFRAHPRVLPVLKKHFAGLSVANNHSGDFGKEAFAEQCGLLEKAEIPYFGGGRNLADAHKPWIVESKGVRIAMLGYCEVYLKSFEAEPNVPGVAWSEHDDEVIADLRAARETYHADVVIPFMHWGDEGDPPTEREKSFARAMIDAGADVVVGTHPHITQGAEVYKGRPIVYSLGNFLFNGFTKPENLTGWALRMTVDEKGVMEWDTVVLQLDEKGVPHPDLKAESPSGRRGSDEVVMRSAEK